MVLFNSAKRDGAVEEAHTLEQSLAKSGFKTKTLEWGMDFELFANLKSELSGLISDGLSLLVISIMCHGQAGSLSGNNNNKILISDILQELEQSLPEHVPLVS